MGLSGALSIVFGVLVVAQPNSGALALVYLFGLYAILAGLSQIGLGFRLRGLGEDVAKAPIQRVPWFASFVTRWTGPNAWIRKVTNRNREWVLVGFRYFCRGRVSRKFIEDGRSCIECDVTIENEFGAVTNTGSLIVELRSRL